MLLKSALLLGTGANAGVLGNFSCTIKPELGRRQLGLLW